MFRFEHLSWLFLLCLLFQFAKADVGTATLYKRPSLPSACYGNDASRFPSNNLFAAAGERIWDNGASCGRRYLVRCLSAAEPRNACVVGRTIQVKIVDRVASSVSRPSKAGTTMVLSLSAFSMISNTSATEINIEFQQCTADETGRCKVDKSLPDDIGCCKTPVPNFSNCTDEVCGQFCSNKFDHNRSNDVSGGCKDPSTCDCRYQCV